MIAVIDTSALLRLILPDGPIPAGLEDFMRGVERGDNKAIAPDLMWVEAANVLNKKRLKGLLSAEETRQALDLILRLPILSLAHREFLPVALELAEQFAMTVYDALFLAVARTKAAKLFTADSQLARHAPSSAS
jgi:predicted nucleic acid-binding protein